MVRYIVDTLFWVVVWNKHDLILMHVIANNSIAISNIPLKAISIKFS